MGYSNASLLSSSFGRIHLLLVAVVVVVVSKIVPSAKASTDFGIPSSASATTSSNGGKLPQWLTIHKDRDKMANYMELARQRHVQCIQKARDAYFSGSPKPKNDDDFSLDSLTFDEYTVNAAGKIPDFTTELERKLFVTNTQTPLFTKEECHHVVSEAEKHFQEKHAGRWTTLPSGQYDVAGFWIRDIPAVDKWFNRMVQERLFPLLVKKFPHFCPNMEDLVVDNAYLFKYTPETGRRTDVHTDSGCLAFTISLNSHDEYSGGGTWFEGLDGDSEVIEMNIGECTVRPGGVKHCGHAVTSGIRYIIGGFCMNAQKVEYVRMLMNLGSEESQKKNYQKAQEALEAAIALNPDFDGPYSHLADVYTKQGETAKAKQVLEHCLFNVNPDSGEIAYSLGVIYLGQEEYEKAKMCMDICLKSDDCDVDAMMAMAQACAGQKDNVGEEQWYERLVSTPGAAPAIAGKAYCNLGVLHEGTDKEIEYYEKSLELYPSSFPASYSLACALASKKDWGAAVTAFRRAIDNAEDKSDDQSQALQNLYRVTMSKLQQDYPSGVGSQEQMLTMFKEVMGEKNFERLSAMRR